MSSSDVSAISTTFTPAATCTQEHLTLMEYYQYQIWLNYPVPAPGTTSTDCYPSQFVSSYFSAQYITTPLPAPTPLICPVGYGTILSTTVSSSEYIACCPSSWLLARATTSTPPGRPAYGGTCYSDISTVVVTAYDNSSAIATSTWVASVSGAQAYALVMEGYAAANATENGIFASSTSSSLSTMSASTTPAPTTTVFLASSTSTSSATADAASSLSSSGLSGRAIAGIVIGCIAGLILFLALGFFFLRRRRRSAKTPTTTGGPEMGGAANTEMEGDGGAPFTDKDDKVFPYVLQAKTDSHSELPGYEAAYEVETPTNRPVEMQGEGDVGDGAAERERERERTAGPHEMAAEN